jgi:hypothetical protein
MLPLLTDMQKEGEISIESSRVLSFDERRPKVVARPSLKNFSPSDIGYLDRAIARLWDMTAFSVSDMSHGVAWKTRENGDLMPYELAYLSDQKASPSVLAELISNGKRLGWRSE